jgi:hypoxanthine phosphoribosyltransferase
MTNKMYYTQQQVQGQVLEIARQMQQDAWMPDYIVGLTRGGLVPANLMSQYLDVPMHALKVSFRDDDSGPESNLWMAEEAFEGKKILVVDDINDSGATLSWIQQDWPSGCLPNDPKWSTVWGDNVRFAVLVNNEASSFKDVTYTAKHVNKLENPTWIVFPWEEWWH